MKLLSAAVRCLPMLRMVRPCTDKPCCNGPVGLFAVADDAEPDALSAGTATAATAHCQAGVHSWQAPVLPISSLADHPCGWGLQQDGHVVVMYQWSQGEP